MIGVGWFFLTVAFNAIALVGGRALGRAGPRELTFEEYRNRHAGFAVVVEGVGSR
jgi:hypothetical protein